MHIVQLDDLLDEAKADAHAQARARERWLRRQAAESATFIGALLDLAESGTAVSVSTVGGRRHDGEVVGLGVDAVVLGDRGEHVVVRMPAITMVRPRPGSGAGVPGGDRPAALDLTFVELLARLVDDAPEVAASLVTGEVLAGTLLAVGVDVLSIRLAPGADGIAYCPPSALSSARLRSG